MYIFLHFSLCLHIYTLIRFFSIKTESYLAYTLHLALFIRYSFSSTEKIHTMKLTISLHSSISESYSVVSGSLWPHGLYTVHGILQARIPEWVAVPFSRGIFPTQESNPGLPHCRQIIYQLSHQGSPTFS